MSNTDANGDSNSIAHTYVYAYTDSNGDIHPYIYPDSYGGGFGYTYTHADTYSYGNIHADPDANANCDLWAVHDKSNRGKHRARHHGHRQSRG
jgi:hypothetical protein